MHSHLTFTPHIHTSHSHRTFTSYMKIKAYTTVQYLAKTCIRAKYKSILLDALIYDNAFLADIFSVTLISIIFLSRTLIFFF